MADEMAAVVPTNSMVVETVSSADHKKWSWPSWIPSSTDHIIDSEKRLLSLVKSFEPWGPSLVRRYTSTRFGAHATGDKLNECELTLLTAAKASGELCLKYIFSFEAFARKPLLQSASEWKVTTSFIYGYQDWMNYRGAQEARKNMSVPCEIIRVPQAGHFVFIDKAKQFHSAVVYACSRFLSEDPEHECFPHGCTSA